jgi:hypothetical protein
MDYSSIFRLHPKKPLVKTFRIVLRLSKQSIRMVPEIIFIYHALKPAAISVIRKPSIARVGDTFIFIDF